MHFTNFDLETRNDKVRVYDGNDTTAPLLHTFSGISRPSDVISSGNTVFVSFVTNSDTTEDGFKITYSAVFPVPGNLQRFLCNSIDLEQWYLTILALFPLYFISVIKTSKDITVTSNRIAGLF